MEFNTELAPEVLTDKDETKTLPCRACGRPCIVNMFASLKGTECNTCRAENKPSRIDPDSGAAKVHNLEIDMSLSTEMLTEKSETKTLPCIQCRRGCVVTLFMAPHKVLCSSCKSTHKRKSGPGTQTVVVNAATVDPSELVDLRDALINPAFRTAPLCPLHPDHSEMELKSVCHTPNYGPRRLMGYNGKGMPEYRQETGESIIYQCNECFATTSYSTMHPMNLRAQNEPRVSVGTHSTLATIQGVREDVESVQAA